MAIVGLVGGAAVVTCVCIWATVRLVRYALETENSAVLGYVTTVWQTWAGFLAVVTIVELWPGLASWASAAYRTVIETVIHLT